MVKLRTVASSSFNLCTKLLTEASVAWIDTEMGEDVSLANSFQEFLQGLGSVNSRYYFGAWNKC